MMFLAQMTEAMQAGILENLIDRLDAVFTKAIWLAFKLGITTLVVGWSLMRLNKWRLDNNWKIPFID